MGIDLFGLNGAGGDPATGGWTLQLTDGEILESNADGMVLSDDASGVIVLDDGSQITFEGVEQIEW